jgi:hypothetical protein
LLSKNAGTSGLRPRVLPSWLRLPVAFFYVSFEGLAQTVSETSCPAGVVDTWLAHQDYGRVFSQANLAQSINTGALKSGMAGEYFLGSRSKYLLFL